MILSEQYKDMSAEDINVYKSKLDEMDKEELKQYNNSFDPDMMGFYGVEGIDDGDED